MLDSQNRSEIQLANPSEVIPAKQPNPESSPRGRNRLNKYAMLGYRIFSAGTILLGTGEIMTKGGVTRTYSNFIDSFTPRPVKPVFPYDKNTGIKESRDSDFLFLLQQNIVNYENWQIFNETRLKGLLETRQPKEVWEILQQQDASSLQQGVSILQTAWLTRLSSDQIQITNNQKDLWINDERFNLQDRFDMHLANSILQTKIKLLNNSMSNPTNQNLVDSKLVSTESDFTSEELEKLNENLEMLTWLKQHPANIKIEDEGMAFFNRGEMVKLARMFYGLNLAGIEQKGQITWCNSYNCLVFGGKAAGEADFIFKNKESLKPNTGTDIVAHESAHQEVPLLTKFKFANIGKTASTKDRQTFISDYAMTNDEEDFAETFMNYLMRGDAFREAIKERSVQGQDPNHILQRKYDFMKNDIFKGIQFTDEGKVKKTEKPISIGQQRTVVNAIRDNLWYPEKPEVCASSVSIVGGPYITNVDGRNQTMWEVEIKEEQFTFDSEQIIKSKALVPEEALGDELKSKKT